MERLVSSIVLTSCLWGIANLSNYSHSPQAATQVILFDNAGKSDRSAEAVYLSRRYLSNPYAAPSTGTSGFCQWLISNKLLRKAVGHYPGSAI